ncbi:MAG: nuclear transport factor 2 family protein [Actinomycetota bacterium]
MTTATVPTLPENAPPALVRYMHMWNERDPEAIRGHLDDAVSDDCLWVDPQHHHRGRDALEANVRGFRETFPDADLGVGSTVDGHNDRYRYEWVIVNEGALLIRGFDVVTLSAAGLIERVDGFFGTLDRLGPE